MKILEIVAPLGGNFSKFAKKAKFIANSLSHEYEPYTVMFTYNETLVYINRDTDIMKVTSAYLKSTCFDGDKIIGDVVNKD